MHRTGTFFIVLLACFMLNRPAIAQNPYAVSEVPEALKANARAVIRADETHVEIVSLTKVNIKHKLVVTVLNENGQELAYFQEFYDKFSKISKIKGTVYDANGKKIRGIPGSEIYDFSAIAGFSAYDDSRRKVIDPRIATYPTTVEYTWETTTDNLRYIRDWYPVKGYNISLQKSVYTLVGPESVEFRHYERNLPQTGITTNNGGTITKSWVAENLAAYKYEPFSSPLDNFVPNVIFSPTEFEFAKTSGNAGSWNDIGKWAWGLNQGRDVLPDATIQKIKALTGLATSDEEKVQIVYHYLQNNTRYVSIQVGIGGFQPFEASVVDKFAYGDCKALSNYMYALLKAVGIKSHYTLVNAGYNQQKVVPGFPSIRFNHVFLCVPLENDTLWLECTSQTNPCGYLGHFTDDRDVLLIKEDGGHLVHTKAYTAGENIKSTKAVVNLSPDGSGQVQISRKYQGLYYDEIEPVLRSDDADKKKLMYKAIKIPDFIINSFRHEVIKSRIPVVTEEIEVGLGNYATLLGGNMFLPLNLLNRQESLPKRADDRKSDIYMPRAYTETDTVIYNLPEGYTWGGNAERTELISEFGTYIAELYAEGNQIVYIRSFIQNKGMYPKTEYTKLYEFSEKIALADQKKIALKKL
ncbi:MAG: DUF3857 domain-containing protein [Bacteroidales bacterium]|nr:DUF3857 domain-containing protein [Bacteroidales bacterium]